MAHLQYLPGDPRLVDQLVYELKSKGIFDQFRKECIADVDTRPAYQNLRQRVESSVSSFLSRQCWKQDLNKNQLREKLRKHLLDGNYLEQGVERIVDQVVNPKVASVFIPQVEDVVYNFLGIPRKKSTVTPETSNGKLISNDLLPTDLEAVSPGSVKSNDDKSEAMDTSDSLDSKMEIDEEKPKTDIKEDSVIIEVIDKEEKIEGQDSRLSGISELTSHESDVSIDKSNIPLPSEEIKLENIPAPDNSPPNIKDKNIDLGKINLPKEPNLSTDIPLPDEMPKIEAGTHFKPIALSEEDESSSDSSLRRNMSPLTPIRNFNNENSCDAQQAFDNDSDSKTGDKKEPSTFRFTIESKLSDNSSDEIKTEKKDPEQQLSYQFNNQVNINTFNTPLYEDSSNSNNLRIDYESDANSKANIDIKILEPDLNSGDSKKERKADDKKSSRKSSHQSRDSHRHSSSKEKRSDSKHSSSRESSRHDKKTCKDDHKSKSSHKDGSTDRSDKKDSRDSSKHRSSHKSSSKDKDSKHRSSSSSKHSSKSDEKKSSSSSSHRDKERSSDKFKDRSKDTKSSSHRSEKDKDKKSSGSGKTKHDEKENKEKKEKKETDDHYSLSGRGNPNRRSTDRDSNDGSSSSKGSQNPTSSKSSESKKDNKGSSKSDNTSNSSDSTSPSDKDVIVDNNSETKRVLQAKPVVRVETHLEVPISTPPRLPFVPDITLKKPRFAANLEEAKQMMKMRKFLEEEQKRMNQEAALLLEFQANVRPSLSQVYSSIPGPELEFVCMSNVGQQAQTQVAIVEDASVAIGDVIQKEEDHVTNNIVTEDGLVSETEMIDGSNNAEAIVENVEEPNDAIAETLIAMHLEHNINEPSVVENHNNENPNVFTENAVVHILDDDNNVILATLIGDEEAIENNNKVKEMKEDCTDTKDISVALACGNEQDEKKNGRTDYFEVTIITEELSENEELDKDTGNDIEDNEGLYMHLPEDKDFHYFAEHEKYNAELERDKFSTFFKTFTQRNITNKLYLINCDTYEENIVREVAENFGQFEIINYHKNGHLKLPKTNKGFVKNFNITTEVILPTKTVEEFEKHPSSSNHSPVFSPVKSECSFELSSDYDAKLEEMVNRTSRQEIMEIILGNIADDSTNKMPTIDYCMESNIESDTDNDLKRKFNEVESTVNNNRPVLTPNKIRKRSESDQISSTTEESVELSSNKPVNNTRSKYLGRARRVGLSRPKKTTLPNSPSSDKSVENYEQNTPEPTPNGRVKIVRNKVQRYDTSDLYKPKLHYLSRRNIS